MEVINTAGVSLLSNAIVLDSLTATGASITGTFNLDATGAVTTDAALTLRRLSVGGVLSSSSGTFTVDTTVFTGSSGAIPAGLTYRDIRVSGTGITTSGPLTLTVAGFGNLSIEGTSASLALATGATTVSGNLRVIGNGASLTLGNPAAPSTVTVTGDLTVIGAQSNSTAAAASLVLNDQRMDVGGNAFYEQGRLISTLAGDTLSVAGNYTVQGFGAASTNGVMTDGVLMIGGDFTQTFSSLAFAASAGHKTIFNGTVAQTISFEHASSTQSRFGILEVINTAVPTAITLASNVVTLGQLTIPNTVTPTITGASFSISTTDLDVDGVVFDNMPLILNLTADIVRLENFTFQGMSQTARQLDVFWNSTAGAIIDIGISSSSRFSTPITGGASLGRFVRLENLDGTNLVHINIWTPTPTSAALDEIEVVGNASMTWDAT